jgi:hypothetical protein
MVDKWHWHRIFSDISAFPVRIILLLFLKHIIPSAMDSKSTRNRLLPYVYYTESILE